MTDRTNSIHALQRAARSEGRRDDASMRVRDRQRRARVSGPGSSWLDTARRGAIEARDFAHYHALRAAELYGAMSQRARRITAGAATATLLLGVVLNATAGADDEHRATTGPAAGSAAVSSATRAPRGTAFNETLLGTPGNDRMNGRAGDDVILGGAGADTLIGSTGHDVLHGAGGNDILIAGPGRDVLIGGAGNDVLRATEADGRTDRLHCGPGNDVAWIVSRNGRAEDVTTGCERVNVIDMRTPRR